MPKLAVTDRQSFVEAMTGNLRFQAAPNVTRAEKLADLVEYRGLPFDMVGLRSTMLDWLIDLAWEHTRIPKCPICQTDFLPVTPGRWYCPVCTELERG